MQSERANLWQQSEQQPPNLQDSRFVAPSWQVGTGSVRHGLQRSDHENKWAFFKTSSFFNCWVLQLLCLTCCSWRKAPSCSYWMICPSCIWGTVRERRLNSFKYWMFLSVLLGNKLTCMWLPSATTTYSWGIKCCTPSCEMIYWT